MYFSQIAKCISLKWGVKLVGQQGNIKQMGPAVDWHPSQWHVVAKPNAHHHWELKHSFFHFNRRTKTNKESECCPIFLFIWVSLLWILRLLWTMWSRHSVSDKVIYWDCCNCQKSSKLSRVAQIAKIFNNYQSFQNFQKLKWSSVCITIIVTIVVVVRRIIVVVIRVVFVVVLVPLWPASNDHHHIIINIT